MDPAPTFPLAIFYDGACALCAAEIDHYLRRDVDGRLMGVDISSPDFTPPFGLTSAALNYEMHVIDSAGTIYRNIRAFQAIWRAFPERPLYRFLALLLDLPLAAPLARSGYRLFARLRPFLPRRQGCPGGVCARGTLPPP